MAVASKFIHLHVHTEYSLLDGAARVDRLVWQAKNLGMDALAITDHGAMHGVVDFYKACQRQGLRAIIGCEVYLAQRTRRDRVARIDDDSYHLVVLAENQVGYKNLIRMVSLGSLDGFYYKPRVDMDLLRESSEGLIVLSGCLSGKICRQLLAGDDAGAEATAREFVTIFGPDNFFIELQDQGLPEQAKINPKLAALADRVGCGLVATNDVHYVSREDAEAQDVLLCIQTAKKVHETDRMRLSTDGFYLKSPEEMSAALGGYPGAIENTARIADRCDVHFDLGTTCLPTFEIPDGLDAAGYLRQLCTQHLPARYEQPTSAIMDRLEYELGMITRMGFADYVLIVWDLIRFARSKSIPVGPGRGSVAGSLVAYVLGITQVDPLRYGLLFERFLNPDRVSMPDVDIDFCFERRNEVYEYVVERYGKQSVAQIITFGTMAARAAIRDVGRALDLPYATVDRIAKMVPAQVGVTLERALELAPELRRAGAEDGDVGRLIDLARAVEGLPRHASVHAAGVVIADRPLLEYVPLQRTADDGVVTQFPMEILEELGLLKMDFLALRTLTVIDDCIRRVRQSQGVEIDLDRLDMADELTYQMLSRGEAQGVFQLESGWVRDILRDLKPSRFEDLIAAVALCRPGPMEHIPDYIKNRETGARYLHPDLEPILAETNGIMIYQEQVMQVVSQLAGFSLGRADILRKAMGKKKPELIAEMKEDFLRGVAERGIDPKTAEEIFHLVDRFAGYGFNKSHAAAYALVVYQTAYLKANYPREYMAALLTSLMASSDKVAQYISDCRKMGIEVLPPDVNISGATFTVDGDQIRFGLSAVKNVGAATIEAIVAARQQGPFRSVRDFCDRVDNRHLNRRALESLIKAGALDSFGPRGRSLAAAGPTLDASSQIHRQLAAGQITFFDTFTEVESAVPDGETEAVEYSQSQLLAMEKEVLGLYISGHPLGARIQELELAVTCSLTELGEQVDGAEVRVGGLITTVKRISTKSGQSMAFVAVEDLAGSTEILVFPRLYEQCAAWLEPDQVILVRGKVSAQDEDCKVIADDIIRITDQKKVILNVEPSAGLRTVLCQIKEILLSQPGTCPVYIEVDDAGEMLLCPRELWVDPGTGLWRALENVLGAGRMREV